VKGALRPSNAKRILYTDEKSTGIGETKEEKNRTSKGRIKDGAPTLSDLYPSTCPTWEALPGVKTLQSAQLSGSRRYAIPPTTKR